MACHLKYFDVKGLFGAFDHDITLNETDGVTIITAPNGYGKTTVLRLINAFFSKDISTLISIAYDALTFQFDDGRKVHVYQRRRNTESEPVVEDLAFVYNAPLGERREHIYDTKAFDKTTFPTHLIAELLPHLDQVAPRRWYDQQIGRHLNYEEVVRAYGPMLVREGVVYGFVAPKEAFSLPDWLQECMELIDCRFIETQRLMDVSFRVNNRRETRGKPAPRSITVVDAQALELREQIQQKLAEFTNKSQELDRTFPHRVIEQSNSIVTSEEMLQDDITRLEEKRSRLVDVGILDSSEGYVPISMERADKSTRNVLQVYVTDNVTKLEVFDSLYKKASVFLDIINEKFNVQRALGAKKRVRFNKDKGMVVEVGLNKTVDLGQLSSGEQHEIVLFYEIIFKMGENTLLLIDEPELSLHVGWQKKFVPDLLEIIRANEMRVLMATHSPQIVNDRRDLRVSLGTK